MNFTIIAGRLALLIILSGCATVGNPQERATTTPKIPRIVEFQLLGPGAQSIRPFLLRFSGGGTGYDGWVSVDFDLLILNNASTPAKPEPIKLTRAFVETMEGYVYENAMVCSSNSNGANCSEKFPVILDSADGVRTASGLSVIPPQLPFAEISVSARYATAATPKVLGLEFGGSQKAAIDLKAVIEASDGIGSNNKYTREFHPPTEVSSAELLASALPMILEGNQSLQSKVDYSCLTPYVPEGREGVVSPIPALRADVANTNKFDDGKGKAMIQARYPLYLLYWTSSSGMYIRTGPGAKIDLQRGPGQSGMLKVPIVERPIGVGLRIPELLVFVKSETEFMITSARDCALKP